MTVRITDLDLNVRVAVAEREQSLPQRPKVWLGGSGRSRGENGDAAAAPVLRPGGARQQERPSGGKDETARQRCACGHSITSSARISIACGIAKPSALAVFRLMTSSNLFGCSTGRSAGLAPLRILST